MLEQVRARVPRHVGGSRGNVVASQRRDRHGEVVDDSNAVRAATIVRDDSVKLRLVVIDEIHFVDRQHQVTDSHEMNKKGMPSGLSQYAFTGVY